MKNIKYFIIDFITALIVSVPCIFLFDWISKKGIFNWLDILFIAGGISVVLIIINVLLARCKKCIKTKAVANILTAIAIISTIIFGGFTLLEWLFPTTAKGFGDNWAHWMTLSVSMTTFFHIQEKRKEKSLKNENSLVVATECDDAVNAAKICAILDENGIKTMIVEKGSPMYINNGTEAIIQIQILGKELQKAKGLIG